MLAAAAVLSSVHGQTQIGSQNPINPIPILSGGTTTVDPNAFMTTLGAPLNHEEDSRYDLEDENRVLLHSGEFIDAEQDFSIPGRGMDLEWRRTYRSRIRYSGPLGENWTFRWNAMLRDIGNQVTYFNQDGKPSVFNWNGSTYVPTNNVYLVLTRLGDGSFTLKFPSSHVYTFSAPNSSGRARLMSITDQNDNVLSLSYDASERLIGVTDTLGRTVAVYYYATGRIKEVVDSTGRTWRYGYDAADNLINVVTPGTPDSPSGYFKTYTYSSGTGSADLDHNILSSTWPAGLRFSCSYDANDRLATHTRGDGSWTMTYGTGATQRIVTVIDRNGNQSDFTIGVAANNLISTQSFANRGINSSNPASWLWQFSSNSAGAAMTTMPDGRIQWVTKDGQNSDVLARTNVIEERERAVATSGLPDRVTRTVYEPVFNQPKVEVDARAFPNGVVPLVGGQLDLTDPLVQKYATTHYYDYEEVQNGIDYNSDGIFGPWHGNIVKTVMPTTTINGAAFASDPPQAAEKVFVWNSRGQLIEERDARGYSTRHYYWPMSDMFGANPATQPVSDLTTLCGYEAKIVVDWSPSPSTIDPMTGKAHLNLATMKRWNSWGHLTHLTDPRQNTTTRTYDALGRVVKVVMPAPLAYETNLNYNGNGRITKRLVQNVTSAGILDPANPWIETRYTWNTVDMAVSVKEEVSEGVFLTTKACYDRNQNRVLVMSPLAVAGTDAANVVSYVHDELDHIYSRTEGGTTSTFKAIAAHAHIDLIALGVQDGADIGTTTATTNFAGVVTQHTDEVGRISTSALDGYGRVTGEIDGAGNQVVTTFDIVDQVTGRSTHEPNGVPVSIEYFVQDERRRLVETNRSFFDTTTGAAIYLDANQDGWITESTAYDADDQIVRSSDDRGRVSLRTIDGAGRLHKSVDPRGNSTQMDYDGCGNIVTTVRTEIEAGVPMTYTSTCTFDNGNRMLSSTTAAGKTTTYENDSRGLLSRVVDPLGNDTIFAYDSAGRRLTESKPLRQGGVGSGAVIGTSTITRIYDLNGNLKEVRDGQNAGTTSMFDSRNRQKSQQRSGEPPLTIGYYADSRISVTVDANGTQVTHGYDGAGRLSSRTIVPGVGVSNQTTFESFTHDAAGRLRAATNDLGTVSRSFDSLGHVIGDSFAGYQSAQAVDAADNVISRTYPSGLSVVNGIDATLNQPSSLKVNGAVYFTFGYNGDARLDLRTTTSPSGTSWELKRTYDGGMRLSMHRHRFQGSSSAIAGWTLSRLDSGPISSVLRAHAGGNGDQYFYDSLYEQVRVNRGVPRTQLANFQTSVYNSFTTYQFDLAYNRSSVNDNGSIVNYAVNSLQQYSQVGSVVPTYDASGNLVSYGSNTYVYDFIGRLVRVDQNGVPVVSMSYDALGRRFLKTTPTKSIRWVYLGDAALEEVETVGSTTTTRQLVWGKTIDELLLVRIGGVDYFPITDQQGSVAYILNASGGVVESYTYDTYGMPRIFNPSGLQISASTIGNTTMYAGRTWDAECALYYNRARYMSPELGRFITRDPIGYAGGINLYAYTLNSPLNGTDPFGKETFEDLLPHDNLAHESAGFSAAGAAACIIGGVIVICSAGTATPVVMAGLATMVSGELWLVSSACSWSDASAAELAEFGKNIDSFGDRFETGVADAGRMLGDSRIKSEPGTYDVGGGNTVTKYPNGEIKVTWKDGSELDIHPDGTADGFDASNNKVHVDNFGTKNETITITLKDGTTVVRHPDGTTTTTAPDGTVIRTDKNGKIISIVPKKKKESEDKGKKEESKTKPAQKAPKQQ